MRVGEYLHYSQLGLCEVSRHVLTLLRSLLAHWFGSRGSAIEEDTDGLHRRVTVLIKVVREGRKEEGGYTNHQTNPFTHPPSISDNKGDRAPPLLDPQIDRSGLLLQNLGGVIGAAGAE